MAIRTKLKKFSDFAATLLPHETSYLLSIQNFQDAERLTTLKSLDNYANDPSSIEIFSTEVDKRKYSHLKNWIEDHLLEINVDYQFEWMSKVEQHILIDNLTAEDEKKIIKQIKTHNYSSFYFFKFYELLEQYRQFLLIRLRYQDHQLVDQFLIEKAGIYQKNKEAFKIIHDATVDIIDHYSDKSTESIHWESWLTDAFYDESLDGYIRYMALVRLTFVHFNYRNFDNLLDKYDDLDNWLKEGRFYSRRILLNYYSNRLLLHTRFKEYDKAVYYGYLSIREKNNDYIHYVNNLCAVLLRINKNKEALQIMRDAYPEMRQNPSFHNKIGFISFYMRCLMNNQQSKNAENYAETFLKAYKQEIFKYRWHIFFTAYLESVLNQNKYEKLLKLIKTYNLLEKDKKYQSKATYLPTITWYHAVALYKEGHTNKEQLMETVTHYIQSLEHSPDKISMIENLIAGLKKHIPSALINLDLKKILG